MVEVEPHAWVEAVEVYQQAAEVALSLKVEEEVVVVEVEVKTEM